MKFLLCMTSLIMVCVGLITPGFIKKSHRYQEVVISKNWKRLAIAGAVLFVLANSFEIIPTGYTGVKTTFGQISTATVPRGFNLKLPFVQKIHLVNNKQQDVEFENTVWGETTERTPVYASNIIVTYQINPTKSSWIFANVSDTDNLVSSGLVSSSIKAVMVECKNESVTKRTIIEPLIKEKLAASIMEKYGDETIDILKVTVNAMDFEDSYNEAISKKTIALQEQETQNILNDTAIAKAEADKTVAIKNAEAKAKVTVLEAEAKAEANKKLQESLTDDVLKAMFYEKWDGQLPKAMGSETIISNIAE